MPTYRRRRLSVEKRLDKMIVCLRKKFPPGSRVRPKVGGRVWTFERVGLVNFYRVNFIVVGYDVGGNVRAIDMITGTEYILNPKRLELISKKT